MEDNQTGNCSEDKNESCATENAPKEEAKGHEGECSAEKKEEGTCCNS